MIILFIEDYENNALNSPIQYLVKMKKMRAISRCERREMAKMGSTELYPMRRVHENACTTSL